MNPKKFIKDWMLVIGMVMGVTIYLVYRAIPCIHPAGPALFAICTKVQPVLLFIMLFLSFSKIAPSDLRIRRWMPSLLLVQGLSFAALSAIIIFVSRGCIPLPSQVNIPLEALMLCMICPTATACAVVTQRLGGDIAGVVTYTILINLLVSILFPLMIPLIHPSTEINFWSASAQILYKVFKVLLLPCITAWTVRYLLPKAQMWLAAHAHCSFYIWSVGLTLAILMTTRSIFHSTAGPGTLAAVAAASLVSCIVQFWAGKKIGRTPREKITAGQSLGQKNTVFAIWLAYTFMDPVVSVAGGFYCIWHNLYNSYQLKKSESATAQRSDRSAQ